MTSLISKITQFVTTDIWTLRSAQLPRWQSLIVRPACIVLIAVREFRANRCPLRASALTFYSLLAVVPVVAMLFGIAKGFGFQERLERQLLENFSQHETVLRQIVDFATNLLANTRGGLVAGIGVVLLFWSVIKILGHVELTLNHIWKVDRTRSFVRKITDYLSIMLIWPINFVLSASATAFIATRLTHVTKDRGILEAAGPLVSGLLSIVPYAVLWLFLTFVYVAMPNTRVRVLPALVGGIVAGTAYQIAQAVFVTFQIGVAGKNAIYGGFAALPLFLIWLQMGWMIVLFGAELSYATQNVDDYESVSTVDRVSPRTRTLITLAVMHFIVKRFARAEAPPTANEMSGELRAPPTLMRQVLHDLVESRLVSPTPATERDATAYQPAGDIARYSVAYVLEALDRRGGDALPIMHSEELDAMSASLDALHEACAGSASNRLLKDI